MKGFVLIALCCSLAYAKPQYNYPAPSPSVPTGSYGAPSFSGGSGGGGSVGFTGSTGIGQAQRFDQISSGGYSSAGSSSSSFGTGVSGGAIGGGGTLVQKHIYVHVAPPEPQEFQAQKTLAAGQATKHYKIIFIKAPSYEYQQQQLLQAQAQNEEKTLVYVLVKKPDDVADITLPTAAPTAPSKPEVYFIRYKAKSEVTGGATGSGYQSGSSLNLATTSGGSGLNLATTSGGSGLNLVTGGSSTSSVSSGRPATNYGPPGQSGPY